MPGTGQASRGRGSHSDPEELEDAVDRDVQPPEAVEEEEEPEGDEQGAADDPQDVVAVAEPAERAQRAVEAEADGQEREREPGRVDRSRSVP